MTNINEILNALKLLNPTDISIDKLGKIILRSQTNLSVFNPMSINKPFNSDLFYAGLLSSEDRIIKKDVSAWLDELLTQVNQRGTILHLEDKNIAALFNLSALLASVTGQVTYARELCIKQIHYFLEKTTMNAQLCKYIIQPWINLGRLDRINGEFPQGLIKYEQLKLLLDGKGKLGLSDISDTHGHMENVILDDETTNLIKTCINLEPIKILLEAHRYSETLVFAENILQSSNNNLQGIAYEALIIANIKLQKLDAAWYMANQAYQNVKPHLMPIFCLRQAEITALCQYQHARKIFESIFCLLESIKTTEVDINQVIFFAKFSQQLMRFNYKKMSCIAYQRTLSLAEIIGDELVIIECLDALVRLNTQGNYEARLASMISRTGYHCIIEKYMHSRFKIHPALKKSVRKKSVHLFNKLLNLSV